jgi:hypothetical protein
MFDVTLSGVVVESEDTAGRFINPKSRNDLFGVFIAVPNVVLVGMSADGVCVPSQ